MPAEKRPAHNIIQIEDAYEQKDAELKKQKTKTQ